MARQRQTGYRCKNRRMSFAMTRRPFELIHCSANRDHNCPRRSPRCHGNQTRRRLSHRRLTAHQSQ
ncbi:hypothetical protein BC567DRAFT_214948 [Phyllosticta citribraziliensis]